MSARATRRTGRGAVAVALLSACTCAGRDAAGPTRVPPLAMPAPPVEPAPPVMVEVPAAPAPPPPLPSTPLEPWFRALEAIEGQQPAATATVIVVGDSHTASDTYSGQLRDRLQARFGDGGRGMAQPGSPWAAYRQESMTFGQTRGWTVYTGNRREPVPPFGLSGVRLVASGEGERVSRGTCADCRFGRTFDRLTVHAIAHPGGGTLEVLVDGAPIAHVRTDAEGTAPLIARFGAHGDGVDDALDAAPDGPIDRLIDDLVFEDAPHQVELVALGDGEVWLTGVATDRSVGGARVDSFGLNGAVAAQWAAFDPVIVGAEVQSRAASLVVVSFGTNEAYGRQFEVFPGSTADSVDAAIEEERARAHAYTALVGRLIETLQGDPARTACLVMLPPDFEEEDARCIPTEFSTEAGAAETVCVVPPPRTMETVRDGLIDAADDVGCAVWDTQRAMGGPGSQSWWQRHDPQWARSDGVHLSVAGYDQIGDAMFADLDAAFARWRAGGDGALETSPIRARPAER